MQLPRARARTVSPCLTEANVSQALATNPSSAATAEQVVPARHPERDLRRNVATGGVKGRCLLRAAYR
jgi:hypothetical protein